jgi:hypothetical protein
MHDRSMTVDTSGPQNSSPKASRRRSWLLWIAVAGVVLSAAAVVGVLIATSDSDADVNDRSLGTQQLDSIRHACAQWRDDSIESSVPAPAWCDDMVVWMTSKVRGGRMGSVMWGDPDQMLATCQQWMSSSPRTTGSKPDSSAWCDDMVAWMTRQMGEWDEWDQGWMMNGPMTNGPMMGG